MMSDERIAKIAKMAGVSTSWTRGFIEADWPNRDDHDKWLLSASDKEIAEWIGEEYEEPHH